MNMRTFIFKKCEIFPVNGQFNDKKYKKCWGYIKLSLMHAFQIMKVDEKF